MTVEYKQMSTAEAVAAKVPSAADWHSDWEEWRQCIVLYEDSKPVRILSSDGGEPEDQTLTRDWGWVTEELNNAYRMGYEAALGDDL